MTQSVVQFVDIEPLKTPQLQGFGKVPPQSRLDVTTDEEFEKLIAEHCGNSMLPRRRYHKAVAITAEVMRIVERHLGRDSDVRPESIHRDLMDMFFKADVDVVTESDRVEAGLLRRNGFGLTAQEVQIIEHQRMLKMLEPIRPLFVEK